MSFVSRVVVALLCVVAQIAAQQTWRVHPNGGSGIHFTDLPAAVAAASAGDTIMLIGDNQWPIGFRYTCDVTIDKPLTIMSASPLGTPGYSTPGNIPMSGRLLINGIAAGERVVLSNLTVYPYDLSVNPMAPHGVWATDCDGTILFEDCSYRGGAIVNGRMRFERCDNVVVRGCDWDLSEEAVTLIDSSMTITNCVVRWTSVSNWIPQQFWYTQTGPALHLTNSHATIIASLVEGASRQGFASSYGARVGAEVLSGSLTIGPFTLLRGGYSQGIRVWSFATLNNSPLIPVYEDSRAYPLFYPTATPQTIPQVMATTYHNWLVAGETYRVSVTGPANGWALLAVGGLAPTPVTVPGIGVTVLDLAAASIIGLQQLDGIGWTEWTRQCPANVPVAHPFVFQAAVLHANGAIEVTVPSPFTVGWPHGVIP